MFKHATTRRQMLFVGISLFAVFMVGTLMGRMPTMIDISEWEIFEFANAAPPEYVIFTMEQTSQHISATLTNASAENEIAVAAAFILVKLVCETANEWRVFPFGSDVNFAAAETILPPGYGAQFVLTPEMLAADLLPGEYKIVTTIRKNNTKTQAWAAFDLEEI
ncbi:MAG: hypothetical protein FWB96_08835 [Defluviitaleaceae bacterium]|nr:hypothetical protein [Defluviitaleaceae bacterium]MCL2262972.1 hypothetical protein [Defluviitaleaceae bacterium]